MTLPNAQEYFKPQYPGPFQVSADTLTQAQVLQEKADWEEKIRLWREVKAVERALVQQLVAAVEPKYLKALRNHITSKITYDIKGILSYLFNNYGKMPPSVLRDMKRRVEDWDLDPADPVDLLFVEVDKLADVFELQQNPLTEIQIIEMAYVVIERAKAFKKDLREWNRKRSDEQTWPRFKEHFRNAQQELRNSGDLTVKEAMEREELVNIVIESINSVMTNATDDDKEKENLQKINATITKENEDIKKQFESLKKEMESMK